MKCNEAIPLQENIVINGCSIYHEEGADYIIINEPGCYLINFSTSVSLGNSGVAKLELRVNGKVQGIAAGEMMKSGDLINLASTAIVCNCPEEELEIQLVNGSKCPATFYLTRITIVKLS